jgi:peroxiredoxin
MSKQWILAGGIVAALAIGGFTLAHTDSGGVVGVDTKAPDFHAIDIAKGDTVDFRDRYKGQVTLMVIWATWCLPCREEMPSMEALYKDYGARGLKISAVSIDQGNDQVVRDFGTEYALTFDILHDQSGGIQETYQTTGVPESFLLDRDGRIVRRLIGSHDWNSPATRDLIDRLLAQGS